MVEDRLAGLARLAEIFPEKPGAIRHAKRKEALLPPRLFQHEDLINGLESADKIDQESLTNILNHIHFIDGQALVCLRHPKYQDSILVRAYPGPCLGKELTCRWSDGDLLSLEMAAYQFLHLIIDDGLSVILVPGVLEEINRNILIIQLPTTSYVVGLRQTRRYACHEVVVELTQNGFQARGELLDFSPIGFRIRVSPVASSSFYWLNSDELVAIGLQRGQQLLFSGHCRFIREQGNLKEKEIVLAPAHEKIIRFKKSHIRSPRRQLVPSPILIFEHPFIEKSVQLEVSDISISGFSVFEQSDEEILIPGMIIPELKIDFQGTSEIKCSAQVIYRLDEKEKGIRCGLAVLEMDIGAYKHLTHLLANVLDPHFHISSDVDMDELWKFFFETGFLSSQKYLYFQSHREDLKEIFQRLYQDNQEIAGHFTYQRNGRIYGHMSMVRAYEKGWLLQHHMANSGVSKRTGLIVLKHIMHYLHDMRRLPSAKIDYVMCYFRPENKFPARVFGRFAEAHKEDQICSTDLFSYLAYPTVSLVTRLSEGWLLKECSPFDFWELSRFYKRCSGGLLLDALGMGQEKVGDESLEEAYSKAGFTRRLQVYSLSHNEELYAVLIANESNLGLNLSDLLNGIKILVAEPESLPWDILSTAVAQLAQGYNTGKIPILIYPSEYAGLNGISCEKQYKLWIYDARFFEIFMEYVQRRYKSGYWE